MRRRDFLTALTVATSTTTLGRRAAAEVRETTATTVDALEFDSTASLLDSNGNYLTDDSLIAVTAETTALNEDADGNGDAVYYDSSTDIPLVAVDGDVVGFGATLVSNQANFRSGNEEFVLNVFDAHLGGNGTVLYDEGHDQYHSLNDFSNMANYAEQNGYTVSATTDLANDLPSADALWLTAPSTAFTSSEQSALSSFVANGGAVFVFDRADYSNFDETANLNDVASALSLAFRFNDDQVTDDTNNGGAYYKPTTTRFDTSFAYFGDRPGMEIDPDATHVVDVTSVADGDTVDVAFDSGRVENVRILGIDTPEKEQYQQYERVQEWEGIESLTYLADEGAAATTFAEDELSNETVELSFDDAEAGIFDQYDRLLGYIHYDADGDGTRDEFYNYRAVEQGYARLYSSAFTNHASFFQAEQTAQEQGLNVWSQSDPDSSSEIRNGSVSELFFPTAASVRTTAGAIDRARVPVLAGTNASQTESPSVTYSDIPLVGVDADANVAIVGAPFVDESYEQAEGYAVDTSGYGNFAFLSNLLDELSDVGGPVLIDGGHGQFASDAAVAGEDAAYYQRYLEGVDLGFEQINDLSQARLDEARALLVATPSDGFTTSEVDALSAFRDDGGAVVLVGSGNAASSARSNLNSLASDLGSDLRLNDDQVVDDTDNVNGDQAVPTTTRFDTSFPYFSSFTPDDTHLSVVQVHADGDTLNDEFVVFQNDGDSAVDLSGFVVEDAAGYDYPFPSGFTLDAGAQVTLHTGSGTDTATDLYWGSGSPVWNNTGDTVNLLDESGATVLSRTYSGDGFDETDGGGGTGGSIAVDSVHADAAGDEYDNLNDEYVVFANPGDSAIDLSGHAVEDEAGNHYDFPAGYSLDAGATVTLHTGSGSDTSSDLYWGSGSPVWNNSGDTVYVFDDAGATVVNYSY
ncbi:DUF4350 domain-containing protein [Haloarchaeobius baliensis]|uniref:DUF4350 domain-containing protein n=1 Tax=Haloarchaeobius baliensis TaxID=1670458 RepID=UPI003F88420C